MRRASVPAVRGQKFARRKRARKVQYAWTQICRRCQRARAPKLRRHAPWNSRMQTSASQQSARSIMRRRHRRRACRAVRSQFMSRRCAWVWRWRYRWRAVRACPYSQRPTRLPIALAAAFAAAQPSRASTVVLSAASACRSFVRSIRRRSAGCAS